MIHRRPGKQFRWAAVAAVLLVMVLSPLLAAGCHTVEGFGKDLETVGQNLQEEAVD